MKCEDGQVVCVTLTGHLLAQINDTYPITNKEQHRKEWPSTIPHLFKSLISKNKKNTSTQATTRKKF